MPKPYRNSRAQRQEWWLNLTDTQKSEYIHGRERSRQGSEVAAGPTLDIPPLSPTEAQAINDDMRRLGLERFIVLPDIDDEEADQQAIVEQLKWIQE